MTNLDQTNESNKEQILTLFGETRDMTIEESEGYQSYLQRISKPTGFDVFSILEKESEFGENIWQDGDGSGQCNDTKVR